MIEKIIKSHQDICLRKHSATHHNIETGGKVILKRHDTETKLQSKYWKQIYKFAAKNGSIVTLQDINGNELLGNITFVKRVNSTNKKEDNISIQEEKKTYPKRKRKTNYYYNF